MQVPLSVLKDIKCRRCNEFVSCGPVHVVLDGGILCGRCQNFGTYRNYAFEKLASYFLYPCCNWSKHCDAKLHWNESLNHEPECNYSGCCSILCSHPSKVFSSSRKIPNKDEYQLQHIPNEMLDTLQCIICQCYLSYVNVYINANGENVCHRCISKTGIPQGFLRNLEYEKLASIMIFPCIYGNRGCPMRLPFSSELCNHEYDCSYGQIYRKPPKKLNKGDKERGVIMTHSGHYYGTITPQKALWLPQKLKDTNVDVTKEYNDMMEKTKKHNKKETLIDKTTNLENSQGSANISESNNSNDPNTTMQSIPSPQVDNYRFSYNNNQNTNIQRQPSNSSFNKNQFTVYNQFPQQSEMLKYSSTNDVRSPMYNNQKSISYEDITKPQNIENSSQNQMYYNSNIIQDGGYNIYQIQPTHTQMQRSNDSLNMGYGNSLSYSPSLRSGNQPNRQESFRVGNPQLIAELEMRNKLKHRDENEIETVSIKSSDTLDSANTMLSGHYSNYSEHF